MKRFIKYGAACMAVCLLLSGCGAQDAKNEEENSQAASSISAEEAIKVTVITEVFGDGQKPSAAALEYPTAIDVSSLSADDFIVENQTITEVYTNSEAALTDSSTEGNYVILKFAYENSVSADSMGFGGNRDGGPDGEKGEEVDGGKLRGGERPDGADGEDIENIENIENGEEPDGGMLGGDAGADGGRGHSEQPEEDLSVSVTQVGEVLGTDGTIYVGSDVAVESSEQVDLVLQDFQLLEYTDPELGCTIPYSVYLPENYDETKEYPLLFFVADASANGDDPIKNLTQGNGATIWAAPEEQAKHECIVVSPQYTNELIDSIGALTTDDNVWSDGLTLVSDLLHYVIDEYSVDENRIYGTGQSQGCMTNIALSDKYPDLFAAQLLVAGQWNVEEMSAMKDKNLWIVVCEGDSKAYPGMNEATANWEALGSSVARSDMWDSTSTPEQFAELVKQTEEQNCKINYTVFEGGNHTYTWSVAYNIEGLRDWLFSQTKE